VAAVTYSDVDALHRTISKRAPYHANRVLALLSKMFSLAIRWGWRADNPCRGIERNQEQKRKRYLSGDELARLTAALVKHPDRQGADIVRLLLLTGALNVRAIVGDEQRSWEADPAARSATDELVGAASRPASQLDEQILSLQDALRRDDKNGRAATLLGQAYLQKARETGDPSYYPKAESLFDIALDADERDFAAMVGHGSLALARHQFADALAWGEQATAINPYHAPAFGVIGDALIELGRYDEAVTTIQQMVDLRPDLASFSRVSYLRELMGDRPGAIEAMEQAATAGTANPEHVAWTRVQLGNLAFGGGDLDSADRRYAEALNALPTYVSATAGQARVAAARGDLDEAAALYQQAIQTNPLPEFVIALSDVFTAAGRPADAAARDELVQAMQQLYAANGVDTDLELALFDADRGHDLEAAVASARAAYERRPSIIAADVLAWTLYQSGDAAAARTLSQEALRLGTRDALLRFHAGMIEARLGYVDAAITHLEAALALNPHFSVRYAPVARATLDQLHASSSQETP